MIPLSCLGSYIKICKERLDISCFGSLVSVGVVIVDGGVVGDWPGGVWIGILKFEERPFFVGSIKPLP